MPSLLRIDASIRKDASVTRSIADTLQTAVLSGHDDVDVVARDVGVSPVPATAWADGVFAPHVPLDQRTAQQGAALTLARDLADELIAADAYIFALPFYNFGVSQHAKAWVDLVMTEPRFAPGADIEIAGRPAQLVVARGGGYGPGTPRHGWDHGTAWYRRILADIWKLDLEIIECELTLAEVTPAMEGLRGLAADNLANAHAAARDNGARLAARLRRRTLDLQATGS